jgi:hypothetical protein
VTGNSLRKRFEPSAAQAKRGNNLVLTFNTRRFASDILLMDRLCGAFWTCSAVG